MRGLGWHLGALEHAEADRPVADAICRAVGHVVERAVGKERRAHRQHVPELHRHAPPRRLEDFDRVARLIVSGWPRHVRLVRLQQVPPPQPLQQWA